MERFEFNHGAQTSSLEDEKKNGKYICTHYKNAFRFLSNINSQQANSFRQDSKKYLFELL